MDTDNMRIKVLSIVPLLVLKAMVTDRDATLWTREYVEAYFQANWKTLGPKIFNWLETHTRR